MSTELTRQAEGPAELGEQPAPRRPRPGSRLRGSVRVRILAAILSMLAGSMFLIGALQYSAQLTELETRVRTDLQQEVEELQTLGDGVPDEGVAPYDDPDELFRDFLRQSVPGTNEAMIGIVDDRIVYRQPENNVDVTNPLVLAEALRVATPGQAVISELQVGDTTLEMITATVQVEGADPNLQYLLVVAIDIGSQREAIYASIMNYAALATGALIIAAVAGYLIAGRLLRPLVELREATSTIDSGDLSRRVQVREPDNDVARLAVNFNAMLDRLQGGFRDQQQFLDDAAHELRTPLTILRGNLETMDVHDPTDVDQVRSLAVDEVDRMDRLVNDLLLLARSRRPDFLRWEPVDVDDLAAEAFARIRVISEREWRLTDPVGGTVVADRQRLLQAIVQLAANAVKYSAPGDLIELGLQWETGDRDRVLVISLRDTGVGIEEHQLRRIFDRFQQVRESTRGEGLGLGLAIVRAIAVGHGGEVGVRSAFGVGSIFEIRIPAVAGSGSKAQDETSEEDEQVWQRS